MASNRSKSIELNSKVYRFTVLALSDFKDDHGNTYYLCRCDCGNTRDVKLTDLNTGRVKECKTCVKFARKRLEKGVVGFNDLYRSYAKSAERRMHSFNLSRDEFRALTKQRCYYCNASPNQYKRRSVGSGVDPSHGAYLYNGIDRIDNKLGYEPNNCVACCGICNRSKSNMDLDAFLEWIEDVFKHRVVLRDLHKNISGKTNPHPLLDKVKIDEAIEVLQDKVKIDEVIEVLQDNKERKQLQRFMLR